MSPSSPTPRRDRRASLSALVVEDRDPDLYLIRRALESHFEVMEARCFGDVTQLLSEQSVVPSVFVIDLHLPDHRGEALIELIRGSDRHGKTPIIVVSGVPEANDVAPRVTRVLRKPFSTGVLRDFALEAVRGAD